MSNEEETQVVKYAVRMPHTSMLQLLGIPDCHSM